MRGRMWFLGGLVAGFVLGARAGRDCYDKMVETAQKVADSPTLQETVGLVQDRATRLSAVGKSKVSCCGLENTLIGKRLFPERSGDAVADEVPAETGEGGEAVGTAPDSDAASNAVPVTADPATDATEAA